jgi:hypothetical protein
VRRRYLAVVLRPLPAAPRRCHSSADVQRNRANTSGFICTV